MMTNNMRCILVLLASVLVICAFTTTCADNGEARTREEAAGKIADRHGTCIELANAIVDGASTESTPQRRAAFRLVVGALIGDGTATENDVNRIGALDDKALMRSIYDLRPDLNRERPSGIIAGATEDFE